MEKQGREQWVLTFMCVHSACSKVKTVLKNYNILTVKLNLVIALALFKKQITDTYVQNCTVWLEYRMPESKVTC